MWPSEEPVKPELSDYYFDLIISQDATSGEIKKAFHILARLHHPDKKVLTQVTDAIEFRQAREAFEVLRDNDKKTSYDADYNRTHAKWARYRKEMGEWKTLSELHRQQEEAKESARRRTIEEARKRQEAKEAERCRSEEAKRHRQEIDDHNIRRQDFAGWAYREAQRLKTETLQREGDERRREECEEILRCRRIAETKAKKADERRNKARQRAQEEKAKKEEKLKLQRYDERQSRIQTHGRALSRTSAQYWYLPQNFYDLFFEKNGYSHIDEVSYYKKLEAADRAAKKVEEDARHAHEEMERLTLEHKEKKAAVVERKRARDQFVRDSNKAAKVRAADAATYAAGKKQREEQEKNARLRMARDQIQQQQQKHLDNMIEKSEVTGNEAMTIDIGWTKKKSVAECLFCDEAIRYYSFRCPDGGAVACNSCKKKLCRFTPSRVQIAGIGGADEDCLSPL